MLAFGTCRGTVLLFECESLPRSYWVEGLVPDSAGFSHVWPLSGLSSVLPSEGSTDDVIT